jgi:hypothetical protein
LYIKQDFNSDYPPPFFIAWILSIYTFQYNWSD